MPSDFVMLEGSPVLASSSGEQFGLVDSTHRQQQQRYSYLEEEQMCGASESCESNERGRYVISLLQSWGKVSQEYLLSDYGVELGACTVWFISSHLVPPWVIGVNQRPVPYQYLEASGEYVRNLVNNEVQTGSTVSVIMVVVLGVILPLALQLLASSLWGKPGDTQAALCVNLVAQGTAQWATESIKLYVGYLRPIFYSACIPSEDYQTCSNQDTQDFRKSFPSGHSSTSFCGLTLVTLYFHHRLGMGSIRTMRAARIDPVSSEPTAPATSDNDVLRWIPVYDATVRHNSCLHRRTRSIIYYRFISFASFMVFMGLATYVATSRIVDNKHFPADVVAGSVLGLGISVYVNGLWYADLY
jgi:membrane-associated phospholipid phosphatase